MDSCNFPRTVDEMLEAGWYNKLLRKVSKANLKDVLNTPEELVQDIFLQIICSDYLSRYNPDYRPFDVYIYAVADNLIRKRGTREGTSGGKKILNAVSIVSSSEDSDTMSESHTVYLDTLESSESQQNVDDNLYINTLLSDTRKSLREFKTNSSVEYDGKEINKDPLTVFNYILAGKSVSEIADILQVSKQYVYVLLHKVRQVKPMQDFYNAAVENNLIRKAAAEQ